MPTLEERALETKNELIERLHARCLDFEISQEMSHYIELLEKHLLLLERRVNYLEST